MDDAWADFRFLQDGVMPSWALIEHNRWWVLALNETVIGGARGGISTRARISVMPSTHFVELAIDAGLEFLDRLRERRVPKFIDTPDALMALCAKAAIRQR